MTTKADLDQKQRLLDAALKAGFDGKADEPVPQRLIDLVDQLDGSKAPSRLKAG
jgi:hypothetical protein